MIIEGLINVIFKMLQTLLSVINIPDIPDDLKQTVYSYIDTIIDFGAPMIDLIMPYNVAKVLLSIVVIVELALLIYKLVMWVITKIPMLNIQRQ